MAKFCTRCGRPLAEGEVCNCQGGASGDNAGPGFLDDRQGGTGFSTPIDKQAAAGFLESMKNRMGLGDEELNKIDAFEKGKRIVPDCVRANEGEVHVKQYTVATLRNRILGIPYTKAIGRIQVTNKRVIFRAPGRCVAGRTTLQHEFAIDELAGIEARREYVVNLWDLLIGLIVVLFGGGVLMWMINVTCYDSMVRGRIVGPVMLAILFGLAGCVPFFLVKKKWLLKLLCEGASLLPLLMVGALARYWSRFWGGFLWFLGFFSLVITIFTLVVYVIRPNLVLLIKTKSATEAIDIKRRKRSVGFWNSGEKDDHTGYAEILPEEDAERCIREINAMINDIQKLGDFGIEKWQQK